jgi:ferredoxin
VPHTVVIDKQICQSSGNCVSDEPSAFGFDQDDLGEVQPAASAVSAERLVAVAARCPALAISIFDESGTRVQSLGVGR